MNRIESILPEMSEYLKLLEPISRLTYPCACQESSIILYVWLKKKGIECLLVAGYYEDPVKERPTVHFWVETSELIVDGVSVQFLLTDYDRPRSYEEIKKFVQEVQFCCKKDKKEYQKEKVNAYVDVRLLEYLISNTRDTFKEYMQDVQEFFLYNYPYIKDCLGQMMYSSLYKIDEQYYGLSKMQFLSKFSERDRVTAQQYIVAY